MYTTDGSNTYSVAAMPNKVPELEIVRNELDKALAELSEQVRGLEARLMPILAPEKLGSNNVIAETKEAATHSQTVSHLRSMVERVSGVIRCVSSIQDRLEV